MSIRTTSVLVGGIITVESGFDLTPFIEIANELVTECCSSVDAYDAIRLEKIERYLAAHFYTNYDPRMSSEKAGTVAARYQDAVALGFDSSFYGQTAMRLDTAGGLSELNTNMKNGKKSGVSISWIGKTETEVIEDNDE